MKQKFKRGDLVHIAKRLGSHMSHFTSDADVIILGSYADQFGGDDTKNYSVLFVEDGNECSWYEERQLTFIRHVGEEGISAVNEARVKREVQYKDLKWVTQNWKNIREKVPGATMAELMRLVGISNPWGSAGEGITYYENSKLVFVMLDPALRAGDLGRVKSQISKLRKILQSQDPQTKRIYGIA